jgi:hypothetical protein
MTDPVYLWLQQTKTAGRIAAGGNNGAHYTNLPPQ